MHDQLTSGAPLAPHTAEIADLLAADRWDIADATHRLDTEQHSSIDSWMAETLLGADWDELLVLAAAHVIPAAPHTADVAEMIAAGSVLAARAMHIAYVTAEFEREDLGAGEANMRDIWMAGVLLLAAASQSQTSSTIPSN